PVRAEPAAPVAPVPAPAPVAPAEPVRVEVAAPAAPPAVLGKRKLDAVSAPSVPESSVRPGPAIAGPSSLAPAAPAASSLRLKKKKKKAKKPVTGVAPVGLAPADAAAVETVAPADLVLQAPTAAGSDDSGTVVPDQGNTVAPVGPAEPKPTVSFAPPDAPVAAPEPARNRSMAEIFASFPTAASGSAAPTATFPAVFGNQHVPDTHLPRQPELPSPDSDTDSGCDAPGPRPQFGGKTVGPLLSDDDEGGEEGSGGEDDSEGEEYETGEEDGDGEEYED
ncbi:hypothetical protein F4861DRAFT_544612, partial [Xylaria intraflava]